MTIEVKVLEDNQLEISWDENEPLESQLNYWTEQDFIDAIMSRIKPKPMKFSELNFQPHRNYPEDGVQAKHIFPNGYGVSIVKFPGSYGYDEDLYEVAVIKGTEDDFEICYDMPITDDVMGHCDECDVENIMKEVAALT
mgnify:CR=1 FL=1